MKDKQGIDREACKEPGCECVEYEFDGTNSRCSYCDHVATKHVSDSKHEESEKKEILRETSLDSVSDLLSVSKELAVPDDYSFVQYILYCRDINVRDLITMNKEIFLRLAICMRDPQKGIEIKNRRWMMRRFRDCFIGKELVDWFIKNGVVKSRDEALFLGSYLYRHNLFEHVTRGHVFADSNLFYHFLDMDIFRLFALGSSSMDDVLANSELQETFRAFLTKEYAEDNLDFCVEVEKFEEKKDLVDVVETAKKIYNTYVSDQANHEVNLPSQYKKDLDALFRNSSELERRVESDRTGIFFGAKIEILKDLERDKLGRFLGRIEIVDAPSVKVRGKLHKKFLELTE